MPRFYFHLHNGTGLTRDEEGRELDDLAAAVKCAIDDIRSVLCDDVQQGLIDMRGRIDIAEESGAVLMSVPFGQAVELKLESDTT